MSKKDAIWLYEYIIKQTKEENVFTYRGSYEYYFEGEFEREINYLLIKYGCMPLID